MSRNSQVRVGTRGSLLATTQTQWVVEQLRAAHPEYGFNTTIIQTTGDTQRDVPFASVGTKGMFVKEIEQALLDNAIDIGVHSLKDMPGTLPEGLSLGCIPAREDPLDAFISNKFAGLEALPIGAIVGTSSARRHSQLASFRPDLQIQELRGNLDTRLRKLDDGEYDAIIVACAGLIRLGFADRITERISAELCLPAVGQGALAIETRSKDRDTIGIVGAIHCTATATCVTAERSLLNALGGGCSVPVAAYATISGSALTLTALVASLDGSRVLKATVTGSSRDADGLGREVAEILFSQGAAEILESIQ